MQLASVLGSGLGTGIGGALIALLHLQGGGVQHALLLHFALMLAIILLALVTARGLPSTLAAARSRQR